MIKKSFYKALFLSGILFIVVGKSHSQSRIILKATVDKTSILIGEQIDLKISADVPENELIRFPMVDSIAHFEILEKRKTDTVNTREGTSLTQLIRITSFDSGHWVIPRFVLSDSLGTDSIPVAVSFTASFDSSQAYHDIKDILDAKTEKEKRGWLQYALFAVAAIAVIIYFIISRKKRTAPPKQTVIIDSYKEAMDGLMALQKGKPASKEFYSGLIDILRLYVFRKKGIQSLQKTTDDLVMQLKPVINDERLQNELAKNLQLADFVKFAKYVPAKQDDDAAFQIVKMAIDNIEQQTQPTKNQ